MRSRRLGRLVAGTCAALLSMSADAALVQRDLTTPGDHYLTFDTVTGLEWLDLTLTNGVSYNSVAAGFGEFTTAYGFAFATQAQTVVLFANAGLSPISGSTSDASKLTAGGTLVALVGCAANCATSPSSRGFADLNNFSSTSATTPAVTVTPGVNVSWDADGAGVLGKALPIAGAGVWLVRAAPVPEPSAFWLLAIGILGLVGSSSRRRRAGGAR